MIEATAEQPGLSEGARLLNIFVAPSKTFADIRRKATWWAPLLVMLVLGTCFTYSIDKKVGFDAVTQKQIEQSPMQSDQLAAMPAADRASALQKREMITRKVSYGFLGIILLWGLFVSLLYWGSINFVMGASMRFKEVLAMWMYGALPGAIKSAIVAGMLWAGVGNEGFDIKNPLGTNPAYYLQDAGAAAKAALTFFDVFGLWTLALMIIGLATISGKTKGQAAVVVVGWWVLGLILSTAAGAMFG